MKRLGISIIVLFAYIFAFEWIFHGFMLKGHYEATSELWRTESAMMSLMGWMIAGQFLIAVCLSLLFNRIPSGYLQIGALLGALYGAGQLIMYSVAPYPLTLTVLWVIGGIVEYTGAGLLYQFIKQK